MNFTTKELEWLIESVQREYEIHDIRNFESQKEAEKYIFFVKEIEKKLKKHNEDVGK